MSFRRPSHFLFRSVLFRLDKKPKWNILCNISHHHTQLYFALVGDFGRWILFFSALAVLAIYCRLEWAE
jgi:hypothetical protein